MKNDVKNIQGAAYNKVYGIQKCIVKIYINIVRLKNKNEKLLLHHDFFVEIRFSQGIHT